MVHHEASRPVHDHVLAVRTSFLAIVRGLEKSGHIVLSLLVAATVAGCWAGLSWAQSAPAWAVSLVIILLCTLLDSLDQKQAAALTCYGGWVLVNALDLALNLSRSSDALAQKMEAVAAPSMQVAHAAAFWSAGMWLSVQPLAMRTRLISGVAGAVLHVAAHAVACHRLDGLVRVASAMLVTRLIGLAWGATFVHLARRYGGRCQAVVLGLLQLGEQLKELDVVPVWMASTSANDERARELLDLNDDILVRMGTILSDPLQPQLVVALSSACKGLRSLLGAALKALEPHHKRAVTLFHRQGKSCAMARDAQILYYQGRVLATDVVTTLGLILSTNRMPMLSVLGLPQSGLGSAGMRSLCESLGCNRLIGITAVILDSNELGPVGAVALGAALGVGVLPNLVNLQIHGNSIGDEGLRALAPPLRVRRALKLLHLGANGIGDRGIASLVGGLGGGELKALQELYLEHNTMTDAGCATLRDALNTGALPALTKLRILRNACASEASLRALERDADEDDSDEVDSWDD